MLRILLRDARRRRRRKVFDWIFLGLVVCIFLLYRRLEEHRFCRFWEASCLSNYMSFFLLALTALGLKQPNSGICSTANSSSISLLRMKSWPASSRLGATPLATRESKMHIYKMD